ncbi:MAG: histidine phosphatase family protein [Chloroflexota bacterium]
MTDTPTQLYLVRHGSTELNEAGILQGNSPANLSGVGRRQIRGVAAWLAQRDDIAAIYSSDMNRAVQSAQIIADAVNLPVTTTLELRERDYGPYDGLALEAVKTTRTQNGFPTVDPFHDWHGVTGVESDTAVYERFRAFVQPLIQQHTGKGIVIVTHSGVIQGFLYGTYHIPPERLFAFRIERGGLFHFVQQREFLEMRAYYPGATIFLNE